jgi:hypothetical protein
MRDNHRMKARSIDVTLVVAGLAAVCASVIAALYAAAAVEPSPLIGLFLSVGPLFGVVLWLQKDARRTGVGAVQDFGYFLLLAWPVVIPWYAFKTRGVAGWRLVVLLFGLIGAAYVTWLVVTYIVGPTAESGSPSI